MTENMHDAAQRLAVTVDIAKDRGTQVDADGWEHHAYVLEVTIKGQKLETSWRQGMGVESSPMDEPATILDSLVSDCTDESFEDWCDDYGYDTDSRKAHTMWQACRDIAAQLTALIGEDELNTLRFDTERL